MYPIQWFAEYEDGMVFLSFSGSECVYILLFNEDGYGCTTADSDAPVHWVGY